MEADPSAPPLRAPKRKARFFLETAITKVNPSEPKRGSAQCAYCARNVSESLRIRCAECPADELDLCVECFSVGAETGPHKAWHAYRVVDSLAFPLLTFDWTAEEELALLEGLEVFGPTSWGDIAEHVSAVGCGVKTKTQCHAHYCERYLSSATAPLPDLATVIGKEGASALAAVQEAVAVAAACAPAGAALQVAAVADSAAAVAATSGMPLSHGTMSAMTLAAAGIAEDAARQALLNGFARPADPRLEGNSTEVTGFNVKRSEFDTEFDADAELPLADMDFRRDDSAEERALKLRMVEVYNTRLEERAARRSFILDRGLLNVKRTQAVERRRAPEERHLVARNRVLARFHAPAAHDAFLDGLAAEARLRARIDELKEWRRAGVVTLAEGEVYETEKRRRVAERARLRSLDVSAAAAAQGAKAQAARANRYLSRDGVAVLVMPSAPSHLPPQPRPLDLAAKAAALSAAAMPPPSARRKNAVFLDIAGLPGLELLSSNERELCAAHRIVPVHLLLAKETLFRAAKRGILDRADLRAVSVAGLDAARLAAVYDSLVATGTLIGDKTEGPL